MKQCSIILFVFIFAGFAQVFAQDANVSTAKWNRLESGDKAFSVAFPPNAIIDAEDRKENQKLKVDAFQSGVAMELLVIKSSNARERFRTVQPNDITRLSAKTVGEFEVSQIKPSGSSGQKFATSFWITRKDVLYFIKISAKTGREAEVSRFLFSIKLQGKPLFARQEKIDLPEEIVPFAALKTTPDVTEAFERKIEDGKINITYEASPNELNDVEYEGMTRKAVIVERPFPATTMGYADSKNGILIARLKVNLRANGQIGDITVLSIENKEFSKACVESARRIRFIPAQINGKNADTVEIVDYTVQIYAVPGNSIGR